MIERITDILSLRATACWFDGSDWMSMVSFFVTNSTCCRVPNVTARIDSGSIPTGDGSLPGGLHCGW